MEKNIDPEQEIEENVTISDQTKLSSITPDQANKIKSLRIENQVIDNNFFPFEIIYDNNIEQIYFDNCSFLESGLWILRDFPSATRIGFTRCGLYSVDLERLLYSSNPYQQIEVLDVSGNKFGNPYLFVDALRKPIRGVKWIEKLIISDNGFDPSIVNLIKDSVGSYIGKIIL